MFATLSRRRGLVASSVLGLLAAPLALASPAAAASTGLIISEVYGAGGNNGADLNADFVELRNLSSGPISLNGKSLQYRSSTGTGAANGRANLSGVVPAGETFLVQTSTPTAQGAALPTPDLVVAGVNLAASNGTVWLSSGTTSLTLPTGALPAGQTGVIDLVGYGTANTFEGTGPAPAPSTVNSTARTNPTVDGDDNAAEFVSGDQTPAPCQQCAPEEPAEGDFTIAEIQGTGAESPIVGTVATTRGIVTATYPTGGYNGIYIQTPGTGGADDATEGASDALFVYGQHSRAAELEVGDFVEVTGPVSEFAGTTEITPSADGVRLLPGNPAPVTPRVSGLPQTEADKEAHEGELFAPTGPFTVTNTYTTNQYGEIWLAAQDTPLVQPTDVFDAQGVEDDALAARNAERLVVLDDGASTNFMSAANQGTPLPWLTRTKSVRVGARATFNAPVVLEFRNNLWKFQPQRQVTGDGSNVATFSNTRLQNLAPQDVGGELTVGTFNVLNYFNTTGEDYVGDGGSCSFYNDREGNPVGVNSCGSPSTSSGNGPRGAAQADDLEAQQAKIVEAINTLDTDVVSLEEIENSVKLLSATDRADRDDALKHLVAALNADAGTERWAHVVSPSPSNLPTVAQQDVIRTAFIYDPSTVVPVGPSRVLVGSSAFNNARQPLAQAFKKVGDPDSRAFGVIVNHFKSKGSGVDDGTGQGNANPDRVAQAKALASFADDFKASRDLSTVFLTGDFNAYSMEDPMQVLDEAGWTLLASDQPDDHSYSFGGRSGSLDHVLVNDESAPAVTGVDVWDINASEPIAFQYSRRNYNVTQFFDAGDPFAASDHNPAKVGFDLVDPATTTTVQVLGTNDFHGRIANDAGSSAAGAAVMAGAVHQLREQNPSTVFAAAGDLIGASTFESFIANDKPTIDALNAAGLEVSAAGNHEFDQGYRDLVERVMAPESHDNPDGGAEWEYIAANVRLRIDNTHALAPTWTKTFGDVEVGFVGAVTEDLPRLVNPAGIDEITVTDIVTEVNAAAADLTAEGADVVVMLVHEGASSTRYADAVDPQQAFGRIVNGVSPDVDAIVSGHTHLAYNHAVPVSQWADEGRAVTERPVVSAGQYGAALNRLRFTLDESGELVNVTQRVLNLKNVQTPLYDADPDVARIVADAVAQADVLGAVVVGEIGGGFHRAKLVDGSTENRGGESTLGNLVAEVQRWATPETVGGAQIAFMNPGGLRADMLGTGSGAFPRELTYKQAATVQPFANTLVNMDLTGAQLKATLEQQWQPGASRPFLKLGASEGFTYTYDPNAAQGSRVTGMWLDGEPIDPTASYSVTVNSFLASGGDGFTTLAQGSGKQDTGITDLQAMVDYLEETTATSALPVDHSQRAVGVRLPAGAPAVYRAGEDVSFDLSSLSMTGPGDRTDSAVTVSVDGVDLGTAPVTTTRQAALPGYDEAGTATATVTLPADLATGQHVLLVTGVDTGTVARVPVSVEGVTTPEPEATTTAATAGAMVYGTDGTVDVTVSGTTTPTGVVELRAGDRVLATSALGDGSAVLTVPGTALAPGEHSLTVAYLGDATHASSAGSVVVVVAKATPDMRVDGTEGRIVADRTEVRLGVALTAPNQTVTGDVRVIGHGEDKVKSLRDGAVRFDLGTFGKPGRKRITVVYLGSDLAEPVTREITFVVRGR